MTAHKLVNNIVFIHIQIHKLIKELKYEINVMAPPENNKTIAIIWMHTVHADVNR